MALIKYTCPPQSATGAGTFSDDLVGFQLVTGGGLTQGNFEFVESVNEKTNRIFSTGTFSEPISLNTMGIDNVVQSKVIFENNFKVYPNFDLSQVTNFTLYGSMVKRISTSVESIISKFPAALEVSLMGDNYLTGATAYNIVYNSLEDITSFDIDVSRIRNPFDVDFTTNSTRNLSLREVNVSPLRNLTIQYSKYSLYFNQTGHTINSIIPTDSLSTGVLTFTVSGNPFLSQTIIYDNLVIRPNDYEVNKVFNEDLDEVERFLLNRDITPIYTATFKVPKESDDGSYYTFNQNITWPLYGSWNLDIVTKAFTTYLTTLNDISESLDLYKTNLVSRFLTTGAFKDFDTVGQKMEKVLQIYGRSFDETNKFVSALAYMNSVNYNVGNDIPSQLLKNLAQTLGWSINISPITNDEFLSSIFGQKNVDKSNFTGLGQSTTPDELNYQYYRNLILNSAYLFKSKGTRKSVEILMRMIGAPDALVEFNEYVYLADSKININEFNAQYAIISTGTYLKEVPTYEQGNTFKIQGIEYTGFTTTSIIKDVNVTGDEYPIDSEGYPAMPPNSESYFYQMGSGWFESTPKHRSPEQVDLTNSVFTGANPNYQTELKPYTYGQDYLDKYRNLPFTDLGFSMTPMIDNNKSWVDTEIGLRSNLDGNYDAKYYIENDNLVVNVKNVDLFLNPAQGLAYDVWYLSRKTNYPIPNEGLMYVDPTLCNPTPNLTYPQRTGVDATMINPEPKRKTFFEFAQTFWINTINVRNRQFITDGHTGGYPTLQSIYWKYLESEKEAGIINDNFTYKTMIEYVNGLGDYWVRLVEQMIPATTIWNTGVKYENSIFHRQKFVWRRQMGCQIIPIKCKPCSLSTSIFTYDCPTQIVTCSVYPWGKSPTVTSFDGVLGDVLNKYLKNHGYPNGISDCGETGTSSLNSQWFVEILLNDVVLIRNFFFNGVGYATNLSPCVEGTSSPCSSLWYSSLKIALDDLKDYGYDYYFSDTNKDNMDDEVNIYNLICDVPRTGMNFKLNVGINFNILCN
jgi:hypothetical protein